MDTVMEAPEIEQPEIAGPEQEQQPQAKENPDKGYREWLKGLREDGDTAKFARRAKDDFSRMQELSRLDPKGIDGIRERLGIFDTLAHGEKKGVEALSAIQESLAESRTVMEALAQGDAESFESLGEEQKEGLLRLAPTILERLANSNSDDYAKAVLPHFVGALRGSELVTSFNAMVNVLQEKAPEWLTEQQKGQWAADRVARVTEQARNMGAWFQAQEARLQQIGGKEQQPGAAKQAAPDMQEHWNQSIYPKTRAYTSAQFTALLKPWEARLAQADVKLSDAKKQSLIKEFVGESMARANANQDYARQMARYERQRRPDANDVASVFKREFSRHDAKVMEELIRRDYGQMMDKKTAPQAAAKPAAKAAPAAGIKIVTMKPRPETIDHQRTPRAWLHDDQYRLKNGSVVQYRP